jgi:uncharacterized protein
MEFSLSAKSRIDHARCDLGATLHIARRLFTETVEDRVLVYVPDHIGLPLLITDEESAVLSTFSSGSSIGDAISALQGRIEMPFSTIIETVAALEARGFLRTDENDDVGYQPRSLPETNSMRSMNVWLHINNECNLGCSYCFVTKTDEAMSEDTIQATVDRLVSTVLKHGVEEVVIKFAGGEPTMRIDLVELFHAELSARLADSPVDLRWAFITNGTVCSLRFLDFVARAEAGVNISLDGYGAFHDIYRTYKIRKSSRSPVGGGSWDKIAGNIDRFIAHGVRPNINTTVSRESAPGLRDLTRWVCERGMRLHFGVVRNLDCDWSDGEGRRRRYSDYCDTLAGAFEAAFTEMEQPTYNMRPDRVEICELRFDRPSSGVCCGIGANHIVVRHDGNLASCPMTVSEQSVAASDDLFEASRRTFSIDPGERGDSGDCLSCEWYRVCANGCPVANTRFNGHPFTKSPLCKFWKYVIPRYVQFYGRKASQLSAAPALMLQ